MQKYELEATRKFEQIFKKLDKRQKTIIVNVIEKLLENPLAGKPLKYSFKGLRRIRVEQYRLIYEFKGNIVRLLYLEHRKSVYKDYY